MSFGVGLRTVNPLAELFELVSGKRTDGAGDVADVLVEKLLEAAEKHVARVNGARRIAQHCADAIRRIRRTRDCIEKGRIGAARSFVPYCKNRLRRERGLVIFC